MVLAAESLVGGDAADAPAAAYGYGWAGVWSTLASLLFLWSMVQDHLPFQLQDHLAALARRILAAVSPYVTITIDEHAADSFARSEAYLSATCAARAARHRADLPDGSDRVSLAVDDVGARLDMASRGDVRARLCASCLRARRGMVCMRVCVSCVQPSGSAMCVGVSRPASTRWLGLVRALREEGLARVCRRGRGSLMWWRAQRKAVGHERASRGHGESAGRGSETHSGYKSHHPSLCNACRVEME